jgi:hypothetical protein
MRRRHQAVRPCPRQRTNFDLRPGTVDLSLFPIEAWRRSMSGGGGTGISAGRRARKFEEAQRQDMESFRDFDAEAFRAIHDPDAISIFPSR